MQTESFITPVIAAALARRPRRRPAKKRQTKKTRKSTNNFVAEARVGAPTGNRNAWRYGGRSQAFRAHRRHVRSLIASVDAFSRQMVAVAKSASRHERKTLHFRYDSARRGTDAGRGFLGRGQAPDRTRARQPRRRLHRRGRSEE